MPAPRVFVVSEPLKWDAVARNWVRSVNLKPAQEHGELVFILPPNNEGSADPAVTIATIHEKLDLLDFTGNDFLLPVGSPLYIAWCAAIAAERTGGRLNFLHWQPDGRYYAVVRSRVFPNPHQELEPQP